MTTEIRAAVLRQYNQPMAVETLTLDEPVADEVRVRIVGSGLCHSDLHVMEGLLPFPPPAVLGHEAAGVVEAVGQAVTGLAVGDHVIGCLSQYCGSCRWCARGNTWLCERRLAPGLRSDDHPRLVDTNGQAVLPMVGMGAFAEQMVVHRSGVVKIDPDMPLDRAALIGCAVVTGVGSAINAARVRPGETCVVIGCGGIGLNVIQGAALAGARRIIAVDLQSSKLELARQFGATDTVNPSDGDPVEAVMALTGGSGVEHAFEAIGLKTTAEQALAMAGIGGSAYIIGLVPAGTELQVPGTALTQLGKSLHGVRMGASNIDADFPRFVDLYKQGKLLLDELIAETITLEQVNEGYDRMRAGEQARSVIVFDS
ncbi:MAG: Zn-dependent alcohol dehydrogenase [Acidimicrobiales bacterium]